MNTLNGRRLVSFVGMTILLGAVAFIAYGASIDCTGQRICVGTESDDSIVLDNEASGGGTADQTVTRTIKGLGGDDNIVAGNQGIRERSRGSTKGLEEIFGGPGDDRIQFLTSSEGSERGTTNKVAIFGDGGDDFIEIGSGSERRSSSESSGGVTVNAGRGDDTIMVRAGSERRTTSTDTQNRVIMDGEGRDTILVEDRRDRRSRGSEDQSSGLTIRLSGDNEADTIRGSGNVNETIVLDRDSGRDVVSCGEQITDGGSGRTTTQQDNGTIILNGNRKATDPFGNNLFRAAREGGTAQTNCDTILP